MIWRIQAHFSCEWVRKRMRTEKVGYDAISWAVSVRKSAQNKSFQKFTMVNVL
jgi:hypothetical protein